MNRLPINKPLVIPLAALLAVAITLTAVTAAVLSSQPATPNYVPPVGSIEASDTPNGNNGTNRIDTNEQQTPVLADTETQNGTTPSNTPNPTASASNPNSHSQTDSSSQQNTITSTLNLAIYTDESGTSRCENIVWGELQPGETATKTIYIKNTGNAAATLTMSTSAWSPTDASSKLTLTWNKEGASLAAGAMVAATLTLQVATNTGDLTEFSMSIIISGSTQ